MEIDAETCRAIAGKWGMPLNFVIKEFHVFDVLGQVAAVAARDESLIFKGGTALNKIYLGGLQRFSEDLDFDVKISDAKGYAASLARAIEGYEASSIRRVRDTLQFDLSYQTPFGQWDNVRIDIASKPRMRTVERIGVATARSAFTGQTVAGIRAYSLDDLLARKMAALLRRGEGKDIYDVGMAVGIATRPSDAIVALLDEERKTMSAHEFISAVVEKLRTVNAVRVRNLTNPYIPVSNRPVDWRIFIDTLALRLEQLP
jgi:predicted nucleotidyltransferase component of viral defense system